MSRVRDWRHTVLSPPLALAVVSSQYKSYAWQEGSPNRDPSPSFDSLDRAPSYEIAPSRRGGMGTHVAPKQSAGKCGICGAAGGKKCGAIINSPPDLRRATLGTFELWPLPI